MIKRGSGLRKLPRRRSEEKGAGVMRREAKKRVVE
jgi:hypothetical protein